MKNYSLTYAGALAGLLASATFLSEADALNLVNAVILLVTFAATCYGRYRAGGLKNIFGVK